MILGIETATKVGSLAVVEDGNILGETTIDTKLNHAASFVPKLDNLFNSIKIDISDVDTIAVDIGPGSFTGIRIGIVSAMGLAQPDSKKLIGVCSLEVLCYEVLNKGILKKGVEYLVPFIDAKRGGVYTGLYKVKDNEVQIIKDAYLTVLDKLLDMQSVPDNSYIFGPDIGMIKKNEKPVPRCPSGDCKKPVFPSSKTVALLAEKRINCGLKEKKLEPMYIYDIIYNKR